jgi:hypothetical protein
MTPIPSKHGNLYLFYYIVTNARIIESLTVRGVSGTWFLSSNQPRVRQSVIHKDVLEGVNLQEELVSVHQNNQEPTLGAWDCALEFAPIRESKLIE